MAGKPPNTPDDDPRFAPPGTRPPNPPEAKAPIVGQNVVPPAPTPPSQNESPAQRMLWGCGGAFGCLLVLLLGVGITAILVAGTFSGGLSLLENTLTTALRPAPPSASVTSSQTIINRIQPLGQLVSTSAQVAKADIDVSIQQGAFSMCNHSANHVASATIEAGIDLYEIEPGSVTYDEATDTFTIRIPRPVITSCYKDFIDQYERNRTGPTCTVDWDDARQIAQYESLRAFRDEAIEGGLLITAERDARQVLTSFVAALTGSEVVIEFTDTTGADPAAACNPEPPRDWQYDPANGIWVRVQ